MYRGGSLVSVTRYCCVPRYVCIYVVGSGVDVIKRREGGVKRSIEVEVEVEVGKQRKVRSGKVGSWYLR